LEPSLSQVAGMPGGGGALGSENVTFFDVPVVPAEPFNVTVMDPA